MKDKTKSISKSDTIKDNMEQIQSLNDWDTKISLIKETKKLIKLEKKHLGELKNKLDNDLENDFEFGKMDLKKVISKIHKNKNLEDKVDKLQLLKLWLKQQKNRVIDEN